MTRYTTIGDVRGSCGHRHRMVAAAERCQGQDSRNCRYHGGYTDRTVVAVDSDGETRRLTEGEYWEFMSAESNRTVK